MQGETFFKKFPPACIQMLPKLCNRFQSKKQSFVGKPHRPAGARNKRSYTKRIRQRTKFGSLSYTMPWRMCWYLHAGSICLHIIVMLLFASDTDSGSKVEHGNKESQIWEPGPCGKGIEVSRILENPLV